MLERRNALTFLIRVLPLLICSLAVMGLVTTAECSPYFLIASEAQWRDALATGKVIPMDAAEWGGYMAQWEDHLREGAPYPVPNTFLPPSLYVYAGEGGGGGGLYPPDPGLVMAWGSPTLPNGRYSSAWKYFYQSDPDLSNATINVTVVAPQFDLLGNQINAVSFGIQDINGNIRSWWWAVGPGQPIQWGVPTTITINASQTGVAAASPPATGYASNPLFNIVNSQFFIVDENAQWVGGPTPVPPPGQTQPRIWNYWKDLVVTPNIQKQPLVTKWSQPPVEVQPGSNPPVFNGWDEKSDFYMRPIMADDWLCQDNRPVTDIHWWGSYLGWDQPVPPQVVPSAFHIGIWTDVPKDASNLYSHPGTLIWQNYCDTSRWNFAGYDKDPRDTYHNEACFQFNQDLNPDQYFYQDPGSADGTVYWLSIAAVYLTGQTPQYPWGWKTRPNIFNDDAVQILDVSPTWPPTLPPTGVGSSWVQGVPIEYPDGVSWDLAFELTTQDKPPKWCQKPDLTTNGIDVKATKDLILADDFLCTKQTRVTDITVWGSWLDDLLPQNGPGWVMFTLSIHDDIPAGTGGVNYSRPGNLRWVRNFAPGEFTVSQYATNLTEDWWDPSIPTSYNPNGDKVCWRYDFDIPLAEAFCQEGSEAKPKVYWLDVQAAPIGSTAAQFGWKTSSSLHWNDDAVWGTGTDCVAPDNGTGTASLPPPCPYVSQHPMQIIDGLVPGDTIDINTQVGEYSNQSEVPGGSFPGGSKQTYNAVLPLDMTGTGSLAGFSRNVSLAVAVETHSASRNPGPIQSFDTDMFRLQGQLPIGDPDFDLLRIVAGTDFGMPSPGHTTLTRQPGGNWAVDSFFDITYRIDFIGAPGGPLEGMSGSTNLQFRVKIGVPWNELRYPMNHPMMDQSIDLAFEIDGDQPCEELLDWGDAPDSAATPGYPTLAANLGANHVIVPGMFLGTAIDAETDGQPDPAALGDDNVGVPDDEDGVVIPPLSPGGVATIQVTASVAGALDAWIDFNIDGDWDEADEQIFVSQPLVVGLNSLSFMVPAGASAGQTFARFRYSRTGGLSYTGPAPNGEVEDYQVGIYCYKWVQMPDLTTDGFDVDATREYILADDFECKVTGPLTDIHVWGSWVNDMLPTDAAGSRDAGNVAFTLSLHDDIPAGTGGVNYSRPGPALWHRQFVPGQFRVRPYKKDLGEGWLNPPTSYQPGADTICWQYDFDLYLNEFIQKGTPTQRKVYWLDVQAMPMSTDARFGWKTRDPNPNNPGGGHWNDDAVWGQGVVEPYPGPWQELRYPPNHPMGGNSIDLAFAITGECLDWGDAPDSVTAPKYPTLAANNGANHVIVPGFYLGTAIDAEADGQPDPLALGDDTAGIDDEDGVVFLSALISTLPAKVKVTASAAGKLDAWIDYNADGDWADTGEKVLSNVALVLGANTLTFTVPPGVGGPPATSSFARFRFSSAGSLSYDGPAADGEVEDYHVRLYPRPVIVTKGKAKKLEIGTYVLIEKNIVTANFPAGGSLNYSQWYFEEPDRSAGLGVWRQDGTTSPWGLNDPVSCYGQTVMFGCELMLAEIDSWMEGDGAAPPVGQNNRSSGGGPIYQDPPPAGVVNQPGLMDNIGLPKMADGLNTVAMLVKLWGKCTYIEDDPGAPLGQKNFWINDGSNLWDGTRTPTGAPVLGVKVKVPSSLTVGIQKDGYYTVVGVMRTDTSQGGCVRWLWPRLGSDIVPML